MAGSLLGPDQIRKVNAAFPALVAHIRELLSADHTGVGLMRVHCMVESFDSDEMARMFRELSFISPKEKLALVRAALYEVLAKEPALFISPQMLIVNSTVAETVLAKPEPMKVFTPAQFNLNVNKSNVEEIAKTDTKPTPPPATSTHTPKIAERIEAGDKAQADQKVQLQEAAIEAVRKTEDQQKKLDAAVAKLRESSKPSPIVIHEVPADASLQIEPLPNIPDDPGFVAPEE